MGGSKKILISDEVSSTRSVLRDILTGHGYDVVGESVTPSECLVQAAVLKPDLVALDLSVGSSASDELDALAALRAIRESQPAPKVVVCAAPGNPDLLIEAVRAGARDFIAKPYRVDRVLEAVDRLLAA
jgi:two-component system, chemotaxis family, chemotaxis protein CheY